MKRKFALPLLLFIPFLFLLNTCIQFRESTQFIIEKFPEARLDTLNYNDRSLRYLSLHRSDTLPTLFFLHGSPSSMSVYNVYYEDDSLAGLANIIAADRPGYGYSDLGYSEISVKAQAEKMWKILEKEGFPSPLYLIGSSYGGTVAAKMAMLKPNRVDGMVLISASLAPGKEKTYGISYLLQHLPFRWLIPASIRVANDEKLSHYESLDEMVPLWERIIAPVILIYGTADRLIFPENADFALQKLVNSTRVEEIPLEGEGHFLQIKYKDMILENVLLLISNNRNYAMHEDQDKEDTIKLAF